MHTIKFQWKLWLLLVTVLVMTATLFAACGPAEEKEKPTIKFGDSQFESLWINNAIAEFIIKKGYGYPVEIIQMTTVVWQVALPKGDVHVQLELWQQNLIDWYNEEIAAGNIENLGMIYEGGPKCGSYPRGWPRSTTSRRCLT